MRDRDNMVGEGAFSAEPERDRELAALLTDRVGIVPAADVDWDALARRISARVAMHASSPWWTYAARWERRMVPIALAAGIAATFALFRIEGASSATNASVSAVSVSTAVAAGTPVEDAALQFAGAVTSMGDITAGVPE